MRDTNADSTKMYFGCGTETHVKFFGVLVLFLLKLGSENLVLFDKHSDCLSESRVHVIFT